MAFLDNSGDIILDAVLTDTGRFRLAKGDGTFKIAKFALGDDEINYGLFEGSHASGSAYYDLQILRSPVLEAFTNNGSSMKSKLITITRNNLLFLPTIELNTVEPINERHSTNTFIVAANETAENDIQQNVNGFLTGVSPDLKPNFIRIDQGLDTDQISPRIDLDSDLVESQYNVQIDNRLGKIVGINSETLEPSFIDDDQIATYYFTKDDGGFVSTIGRYNGVSGQEQSGQVITGPRGTKLHFKIRSTAELQTSDYLFNTLGSSGNEIAGTTGGANYKMIDTFVRVQGIKTGASMDIPVRFIKRSA